MDKIGMSAKSIFYGLPDELPYCSKVDRAGSRIRKAIKRDLKDDIEKVEACINTQRRLSDIYFHVFASSLPASTNPFDDILYETFSKNLATLKVSLDLACNGHVNHALSFYRTIFESQVLSKYCSLSSDYSLYKKWDSANVVYFSNEVLKNIVRPNYIIFQKYYHDLSNYSHANLFSHYHAIYPKEIVDGFYHNLAWIFISLQCNYHILSSHLIFPQHHHYISYYKEKEWKEAKLLRSLLQSQFNEHSKRLTMDSKRIIQRFKSKWELKKYLKHDSSEYFENGHKLRNRFMQSVWDATDREIYSQKTPIE